MDKDIFITLQMLKNEEKINLLIRTCIQAAQTWANNTTEGFKLTIASSC